MQKKPLTLGIDEVGRGSWAGPVVAAACAFLVERPGRLPFYRELNDSKKLLSEKREELFSVMQIASEKWKLIFGVGIIDPDIIDSVGIREANRLAMEQAMKQVFSQVPQSDFQKIRIDGRDNYRFDGIDQEKIEYIVRGDESIKEIQAASILAKVTRDRLMIEHGKTFPEYGFERHKGYGTEFHQDSLDKHGPISIHRKSYEPVKILIPIELWDTEAPG